MEVQIEDIGDQFIVDGPHVEKKICQNLESALEYISEQYDVDSEEKLQE